MNGLGWIFDDSPIPDPRGFGDRAVRFIRSLKHPKSKAQDRAFQLDPWMERIVRRIYGPVDENGNRIVKNVVLLLPRGNRKTSLGAALAILHALGPERVAGGQTIFAASDRKQARLAYDEAVGICEIDRRIKPNVRVADSRNKITHPTSRNVLEAISCDAGTQHGRTPSFVLADELHAWKKPDLWHVLKTGLVKIPNSLLIVATTAGRGQENVAWDIVNYARRVAAGEIDDPATLPILFEPPADADWRDEDVWHAVNPGLRHGYPDIGGLRQLAREAASRPADRDAFKQLHCNFWQQHSLSPFVDMAIFDAGNKPVDLEALKGQPCWLAVDLSSNSDLTVITACWRGEAGEFIVHPWFFCPEENLQGKADRDGVPYPTWAEEGFIEPTPGNVVSFIRVEEKIRELCEQYAVQEIAFDPHLARNMMANLLEDSLPVIEMRQGWVTMAPAIAELDRAIVGGKFIHGGNPVLRWNFDNIAMKTDTAGNRSFHKGKSRDRIDGAVTCAMAVARAAAGDGGGSVYDSTERPSGLMFF
jgi:phage terminase large subunit-like protein